MERCAVAVVGAERLPALGAWQHSVLGGPALTAVTAFVVLPLLVLQAAHRNLGAYDLAVQPLSRPLEIGLKSLMVVGPAI